MSFYITCECFKNDVEKININLTTVYQLPNNTKNSFERITWMANFTVIMRW